MRKYLKEEVISAALAVPVFIGIPLISGISALSGIPLYFTLSIAAVAGLITFASSLDRLKLWKKKSKVEPKPPFKQKLYQDALNQLSDEEINSALQVKLNEKSREKRIEKEVNLLDEKINTSKKKLSNLCTTKGRNFVGELNRLLSLNLYNKFDYPEEAEAAEERQKNFEFWEKTNYERTPGLAIHRRLSSNISEVVSAPKEDQPKAAEYALEELDGLEDERIHPSLF